MALTIYFSKVFGIGLVIIGAVFMIRRHYFVSVMGAYVEERLVRVIVSLIELLAGLFLVVGHNVWSPLPAAIISLLGWIAVVEATAFLLVPDDSLAKFLGAVNTPAVYVIWGAVAIAIGIYLAGFGFGWWGNAVGRAVENASEAGGSGCAWPEAVVARRLMRPVYPCTQCRRIFVRSELPCNGALHSFSNADDLTTDRGQMLSASEPRQFVS